MSAIKYSRLAFGYARVSFDKLRTSARCNFLLLAILPLSLGAQLLEQENLAHPTVLFAHGLTGHMRELLYYTHGTEYTGDRPRYLFKVTQHNLKMFNFFDAIPNPSLRDLWTIFSNTFLAQSHDVYFLRKTFDAIKAPRKIGFGVSRGGSTWLSMLGQHEGCPKLDALILEAPFASIRETAGYRQLIEVVRQTAPYLKRPSLRLVADKIWSKVFPNYDISQPQPIEYLAGINREIPILIVYSSDDAIVPARNGHLLCAALKKLNFPLVYYLEVPSGVHGNLLWHKTGGFKYRNVVHAFFKKLNLPHNPAFAAEEDIEQYKI